MYDLIFARKLLDTRGDFCENLARFVPSGSSLLSVFLLLFPFTFRLGLTKTWRKRESHAVCPTSDVIIQCGCNRTSSEYAKNMNSSRTSDIFFFIIFFIKAIKFLRLANSCSRRFQCFHYFASKKAATLDLLHLHMNFESSYTYTKYESVIY